MGIALELFRKQRYEEGHAKGVEEGIDIGRAERDALRKRIAELESRNGASPEESHASDEDGSPK